MIEIVELIAPHPRGGRHYWCIWRSRNEINRSCMFFLLRDLKWHSPHKKSNEEFAVFLRLRQYPTKEEAEATLLEWEMMVP